MTKHLQREIENLKQRILALSAQVEESVIRAIDCVKRRDAVAAQAVIGDDDAIDQLEVNIEEECLKILALHQPVATDLRFIVAVLKINNDLERIADLASNIASRAKGLSTLPVVDLPFDLDGYAGLVKQMLKRSLDCFVNLDLQAARGVCAQDAQVDALHKSTYVTIASAIRKDPANLETYIMLLSISRQLERIADHATNISEDVIYMVDGTIVRHSRH